MQQFEKNARSVILITEKNEKMDSYIHSIEMQLFMQNVALTLFDATNTLGDLLNQSGKLCHYLLMVFRGLHNAIEFMSTHDLSLRFSDHYLL